MFECLTDANGESGIDEEIPYVIDLPRDFVEDNVISLLSGASQVCIPGGRAIRLPNSTLPDQIVIPEGAELRMTLSAPGEPDLQSFGNRSVLVVRVSGTNESPVETVEQLAGAVFGLGSQALNNSMRAQYGRCSFSRLDFRPASGNDNMYNGVVDIQLGYSLRGSGASQVVRDAIRSVRGLLGLASPLKANFDHVMFCVARGTTLVLPGELNPNPNWVAHAELTGWRSFYNSDWCDSLSLLMHEIGHNLGLSHSGTDSYGVDVYGDTSGTVSRFSSHFFCLALRHSSHEESILFASIPVVDGV